MNGQAPVLDPHAGVAVQTCGDGRLVDQELRDLLSSERVPGWLDLAGWAGVHAASLGRRRGAHETRRRRALNALATHLAWPGTLASVRAASRGANEPSQFGTALQRLRREAGLSQQELADRAGLSLRGIADLERGRRRAPYPATVRQLADALGLDDAGRASMLAAALPPQLAGSRGWVEATPSLPLPLNRFVGREREVAEVRRLVDETRLLTLVGPGGIGKTRLAIEVVRPITPSAFVDLAPVSRGQLIAAAIAATLGIREHPQVALLDLVVSGVAKRSLLLILDNCEHLIEACAQVVNTLLHACPEMRILATSRESLGVAGEVTWRVPPLAVPEASASATAEGLLGYPAAQLFVERATAAGSSFALSDAKAAVVAELVRRLDGIPLAIELAAARAGVLGVAQLLERLNDRFRILSAGSRTAPTRQQTLRAAIDWSYRLLSAQEQLLFARLAVFAGGWALEAAEAVCTGNDIVAADVAQLLGRLIDKSLVVAQEVPGGVMRYHLLETLREYGAERLAESGEETVLRERHRAWCVDVAEQGERDIWGPDQIACLQRLQYDHDNFRAALGWTLAGGTHPEPGLRIAAALARFWDLRGAVQEGTGWLTRLLELPGVPESTVSWARATTALGYLSFVCGDAARARLLFDRALGFWQGLNEPRGLAVALFFRGLLEARPWSESDRLAPLLAESLALSRRTGPRWTTYLALFCLGEGARTRGDLAEAEALFCESLTLAHAAGDRWGGYHALYGLAVLELAKGNTAQAAARARESLARTRELGDARGASYLIDVLACVAAAEGRVIQAARLFAAAEAARTPVADFTPATLRADRERAIATARRDERTFATAWEAGRKLSLEQASVEALTDWEETPDDSHRSRKIRRRTRE